MISKKDANRLARLITEGRAVIFSGAGISTESGLPDFRSKSGLWSRFDPTRLASVDTLESNYEEFRRFYIDRLMVPENVRPNTGHTLIAKWEKKGFIDGVITQNVDRLHQRAGSVKVAELHGSLEPVRCHSCKKVYSEADFINGSACDCGGKLRPGVVLFGEMLPQDMLNIAEEWTNGSSTFIVVGSSLTVSPANYFPRKAKDRGARLIIINRDETPLDGIADMVLRDSIGVCLQEADACID